MKPWGSKMTAPTQIILQKSSPEPKKSPTYQHV